MDKRIAKSLGFIEKNISRNLKLSEIAGEVFLSPHHFHRLFKKCVGISPAIYIRQLRLKKSKEILSDPDMQIIDVALRLGFKNYETFSKAFKKYYKISPGDLRAILNAIRKKTDKEEKFFIVASNLNGISEKIQMTKEKIGKTNNNKVMAYVAGKVIPPGTSEYTCIRNKYFLMQYDA